MCLTGPGVFTASVREVVAEMIPDLRYRIVYGYDYFDMGGVKYVFEHKGPLKTYFRVEYVLFTAAVSFELTFSV